jgi:pimeloyl-ACP methyl ester carboxylesterase
MRPMKKPLNVLVTLLFLSSPILQGADPKATPTPKPGAAGRVSISSSTGSSTAPPPGAKPAEIQDVRVLTSNPDDPYEYERLGLSSVQANELGRAREFFVMSWKAGELPTAAYNLACLDAREGKSDSAFKQLEKAVAAGFDDERTLLEDTDLTTLRKASRFSSILASARKNRAVGTAAVVEEGIFLAPAAKAGAILVVIHDASSDPLTASGPFVEEARRRGLFLAVPRGPARAGRKRFGWGTKERALAAVEAAVEAARKKVGIANFPAVVVGVGRGGTLAYVVASSKPGLFLGVASIGGPYDPGTSGNVAQAATAAAGLKGAHLFFGIPKDAPEGLVAATRRGNDALHKFGFSPTLTEWPGAGTTFPKNVAAAVKETLDFITGVSSSPKAATK